MFILSLVYKKSNFKSSPAKRLGNLFPFFKDFFRALLWLKDEDRTRKSLTFATK